jgi:hypothetical protein
VPYVIRPKRFKASLAALVAGTLLALIALPAAAHAACPSTTTTQPFKQFGDSASYGLMPNGGFETGTSGWALTNAAAASGNESYKVRSASDSKSLVVQPTGIAVSPAICVDIAQPSFRFFARQTSGSWATMVVKLRWTGSDGKTNDTVVGSLDGSNGYTAWKPSPAFALSTTLPLWQSGQTLSARLVFDPENYGGAWAIDDVYVDPYRR